MIKLQKPRAFYDTFDRKGPGQKSTHYCPGCGHGIAHKLIAKAIDELKIQDRTVMCSPVGCSVFLYYYFDTGNVQCSHGRAPAVATGLRRSLDDAIVVCYQGDGDLAGIGTTEIIHAANRGENLTVFFINNAIYGMTGGQMAPTTLLGQKTMTTPLGRDRAHDGNPIGMAEVINALNAPVYIDRVSLSSTNKILKTEKAIKKALVNQIERRGFSFVEILSPCPVSWKMEPVESRTWMTEHLEAAFPVTTFRDNSATSSALPIRAETHPVLGDDALRALFQKETVHTRTAPKVTVADQQVKIGGFGGQGVMSAGVLLAGCAIAEGMNATWLPSYGPEMRGGTANASVIISHESIGSPVVDFPTALIAMNAPSLDLFEDAVRPGGMILVNSSIISRKVRRSDVRAIYVPASDLAKEEGFIPAATVIPLTVYILASKVIDADTLRAVLPQGIKKKQFVDLNLKIVTRACRFYAETIAST
jgi:2-oxoisovalerate ferredoxin oxidoreductase beta subunit